MADILVVDGDVIWQSDEMAVIDGPDAVSQQAYLRAVCDLGESIFYDGYGSRLFQYLGKPFSESSQSMIEAEAKEVLLQTEGITEVLEVSLQTSLAEGKRYPSIFARYRLSGSEKVQENTFKLLC